MQIYLLNKTKVQFLSHISHILNAHQPCMASGYHVREGRYRTFPLLQEVPLDSTVPYHFNNTLIPKYVHSFGFYAYRYVALCSATLSTATQQKKKKLKQMNCEKKNVLMANEEQTILRALQEYCFCFVQFCFVYLGPHQRHIEIPRLGVELELPTPQPQQHQLRARSVIYATAHGNTGFSIH